MVVIIGAGLAGLTCAKTTRSAVALQSVPYATLRQPPGFATGLTSAALFENMRYAGEQVLSSSIEAAMHSGQQAAMDCLTYRN